VSLGLYLLDRCDSNCRYCFNWERAGSALTPGEAAFILAAARSRGHQQVTITGGEPFLHPDLPGILDQAYGLGFRISILTNGLHVSREMARRLAGKPRLRIRVSLDGAAPASNDALRGAGAFDRAVASIRLLAGEGIQCGIGFTVSEQNLGDIGPVVRLAGELGCHFVRFSPVVRLMKGKQAPAVPDLHERALARIVGAQLLAPPTAPAHVFDVPAEALTTRRCEAGVNFIAINADRTLLPCPLLRGDPAVFRKTFAGAADLDEMAAWSDGFFGRLRPRLRGACADCEYSGSCCGGCPAEKLSFDLDVCAEQPVCPLKLLKKVEERHPGAPMRALKQAWFESMHAAAEPAAARGLACFRQAPFWTVRLGEPNVFSKFSPPSSVAPPRGA
jgi:radical SAM protein with 4Fe4S-binding SPASM domain